MRYLVYKYENFFQRVFEIIPGLTLWSLMTLPLWLSPKFPILTANLVLVLASYWVYRSCIFQIGLLLGYYRYKAALKTNWIDEINRLDLNELPDPDSLPSDGRFMNHLIVFPIGGANYSVLKQSLRAIDKQSYPKEKIYISISFEERLIEKNPSYYKDIQKKIRKDFEDFGDRILIFEHPKDIPGEAIGAAANRTWGAKNAVEELERRNLNISDFLITSPDEDLRFHHQYLAAANYRYLISTRRQRKFIQTGAYLFHNNYWKVPPLIRAWSNTLSLATFTSSVTNRKDRETWSCYTLNLQVLKNVNYWDTSIGIDDTPFFWRPFDYFDGDFTCEIIYTPLYADAVYHKDIKQNHIAQFKQLVRWGWGIIAFPIGMKVLSTNHKIPIWKKIHKLFILFNVIVLFKITTIALTLFIPLIGIINDDFNHYIYTTSFSETISILMNILVFFVPITLFFKYKLYPKFPKDFSTSKKIILILIDIPLFFVLLITYGILPFLIGPTKLMFGYRYEFWVTPKK